jgi:hypothetical protein
VLGRTILAGVLGGLVVFVWGAVSHMALGLGESTIRSIPAEDAVLGAMKASLKEPGFYFFPGMPPGKCTPEQEKEWTERFRRGPTGVMAYSPQGSEPMSPVQLLSELGADILAALLGALLLARATAGTSFLCRWSFVLVLGAFAAFSTNLSYWIWYRFPADYTLMTMVDEFLGWAFAGLVLARMIRPAEAAAAAAPVLPA